MAGLTTISGHDIIKMFNVLLKQNTEEEFNAAANMMVTTWNQLVPEWKPPANSPGWLKFCEKYPKAATSHIAGHPSMTTNTEEVIPLLYEIFERHQIPLTKEEILENPVVGDATFVTHNAPWAQKAPHNNRVEYTIKLETAHHPQAASEFYLVDCFFVMRHTGGNKKTLNMVTRLL